jgi:hypothetical protein
MKTLFGYGTVMALAMTAMACSKSADSPSTLEVTGKVDTQLRTLDNASALAIGSDGRTYSAYIQKNGSFRLSLPVGKVYRIIFANSTMKGELRAIGHLMNSTSNGKFDEIAVKDGGTMNLGVVRPVGTSASALHTACNCGSTGSSSGGGGGGGGSDGEKSGGSDKGGAGGSDHEGSGSEGSDDSGGSDYETKDKDGDKDRLCDDSSDVELEAEHGPGDKCAKDDGAESAPKPSKKSCSTKDDNHDGKDDDDGASGGGSGSGSDGEKGGSTSGGSSGGADSCSSCSPPPPSSCNCSKECGAGSSCVASKCTPDAAPSGGSSGAGTSSSSGSTPPVK